MERFDMNEEVSTKHGMGLAAKLLIVLLLVMATAGAFYAKNHRGTTPETNPAQPVAKPDASKGALPRLIDLGADKCIPCKAMAPILEGLKKDFASTFGVEFIDVWKNPQEADKYGVKIIPTQIFFDASGKELFRHQGFLSKEDILAKWREFGVEVQAK